MGSPSISRSMSTEPLRRRKTLSAVSPSLKRTCSLAKCVQVIAVLSIGNTVTDQRGQTSLRTSASVDEGTHTGNSEGDLAPSQSEVVDNPLNSWHAGAFVLCIVALRAARRRAGAGNQSS